MAWSPVSLPITGIQALHVASYFGDLTGDQAIRSDDARALSRVAAGLDSFFAFFPLVDPVLLGDISGAGAIHSNDAGLVSRVAAGLTVPQVPPIPTGIPNPPPNGPDPEIFIPSTGLSAAQGGTVTVPVQLTVTEASSITLGSTDLVIGYDSTKFSVSASDITNGDLTLGWSGAINLTIPGIIIISQYTNQLTPTSLSPGTTGTLYNIVFHVRPTATTGDTPINLRASYITSTGQEIDTDLFDFDFTPLTLSPAPTNANNDPVDGVVTIQQAGSTTVLVTSSSASPTLGAPITFTATITPSINGGAVGGTVTFLDGTIVLGTANVDFTDTATLTTSTLSLGTHAITAIYSGNNQFSGSTSPVLVQQVLVSSAGVAIFIPQNLTVAGTAGATVTVPVQALIVATPNNPADLGSVDLVIAYDSTTFSVSTSDVTNGDLTQGWTVTVNLTNPGILIISASTNDLTATTYDPNTIGTLFRITFTVLPGASAGPSPVNLLASYITSTGQEIDTDLFDFQFNPVTLSPAPTNDNSDVVDGTITIAPLQVASFQVNDGSQQRSKVTSVTYTFNEAVRFTGGDDNAAAAFELLDANGNAVSGVVIAASVLTNDLNQTVVTLTFSGTAVTGGSLADGRYQLKLLANNVSDAAGQNLFGGDRTDYFFREYGDALGIGSVNDVDAAFLASTLGKSTGQAGYLDYFDFDGDGTVDSTDADQFNLRLGTHI
jgi:hypothetical protein